MKRDKILVTGSSGFIGFHLVKKLCQLGYSVIGIDNHNDYYDVSLKEDRLSILKQYDNFSFYKFDISDKKLLHEVFINEKINIVINLAAQAGVRYSIINPDAYVQSNLIGFMNILEECRHNSIKHLIYASSSSVYGGNKKIPFSTNDSVDHPVSLYAATKKSNELLAHSYSHLYNIPTTGLRFFTVYGPFGRPDMAYYSFTQKICNNETISIFNEGKMERDFTYIDDIVEAVIRLVPHPPCIDKNWSGADTSSSFAPYKIYNIGNSQPESLMYFIEIIEKKLGKKAQKKYMGMQDGDVVRTYADTSDLEKTIDFKPRTSLEEGLEKFINWYIEYNNVGE